jgi:hypothetical protein
MRAHHSVPDPIFIQYVIMIETDRIRKWLGFVNASFDHDRTMLGVPPCPITRESERERGDFSKKSNFLSVCQRKNLR